MTLRAIFIFSFVCSSFLFSCASTKKSDEKIEIIGRLTPGLFPEKRSGIDTVYVMIEFQEKMPQAPPHIEGNYYISSVSYASLNFCRNAWGPRYFNFHTKSEIDLQRDKYYKLIVNWKTKEFDDKIKFFSYLVTPSVLLSYFYEYDIVSYEEVKKSNIPVFTKEYSEEINNR